jgi:hypothetical protein
MSPNTAVAIEDILQYELLKDEAATAVASLTASTFAERSLEMIIQDEVDEQRNRLSLLEAIKVQELGAGIDINSEAEQGLLQQSPQLPTADHLAGVGELHQQHSSSQQVNVVYTPFQGKRPYRNSPMVYANLQSYRKHVQAGREFALQYNKAYIALYINEQ